MSTDRPILVLAVAAVGMLVTSMLRGQEIEPPSDPTAFAELATAESQEADEIETDRDSFTPATTTAGYGRVIFESSYSFIDNRSVPETHSFPELLVRQGINDWLELRWGWNYEVGGAGSPISGNVPGELSEDAELERESRFLYGIKAATTDEDGWMPASAIIVQGFTPTSGQETATQLSTTYVFGWTSSRGLAWDSAVRYSTSSAEEDDFNVWSPSTVIKVPVGERWKLHAEYFGVFSDGRSIETTQNFFSPGAHYLINSNLEIGVRIGWGLNEEAPNFFSNAGIGWRY